MFHAKLEKKLYRVERAVGLSARIDKFLSCDDPVLGGKPSAATDGLNCVGEIRGGIIESLYQIPVRSTGCASFNLCGTIESLCQISPQPL